VARLPRRDRLVTYRRPADDVVDAVLAPLPPLTALTRDRSHQILVEYERHPPVELLLRPALHLGGIRIDPATSGVRRTYRLVALDIVDVATGARRRADLPAGASLGVPRLSPDSTTAALTVERGDGIELWLVALATGAARRLGAFALADALVSEDGVAGAPFDWQEDGRLLVLAVPADRGPAPPPPAPAPRLEETAGKRSEMRTFQGNLATEHDAELFEHHTTVDVLLVDAGTGAATPVGPAGIVVSLDTAPDGEHVLVRRLHRPFSTRVPAAYFARTVEVRSLAGGPTRTIATHPVSDEIPRHGVPLGPRAVGWQPGRPATLVWAEALDGGDPARPAERRDRLFRLDVAAGGEPEEIDDLAGRLMSRVWLQDDGRALVAEHDRDRRWRTTTLLDLDAGERTPVHDRSVDDAYGDPGTPVVEIDPTGRARAVQQGTDLFLAGAGAREGGDRPFLDRFDLTTRTSERVWESSAERRESFTAFADTSRSRIIVRREGPGEPPHHVVVDLGTGEERSLYDVPDPHPWLQGMRRELVRYERADGVQLSGWLTLPPGHDPATDGPLPLVIWAYPQDYGTGDTAGQVRGDATSFVRLSAESPLWFAHHGYAVLDRTAMPVIGDPETKNDTFVEQVVASAAAAIDHLVAIGVADPGRVLVGGHSYGAYMTATLLAHSDLFAAGIARSGAYLRALTPFGFQTERRSYWEVPELYEHLSPYRYADRITAPLLLIHGEDDANSGTHTFQTERLFQAIQGTGGTARLVLLPGESHGYQAVESVLHVLAEQLDWADRWLTPR
jgi:dipeptidyl aminopeptidase/acylaminoacyl peptidase